MKDPMTSVNLATFFILLVPICTMFLAMIVADRMMRNKMSLYKPKPRRRRVPRLCQFHFVTTGTKFCCIVGTDYCDRCIEIWRQNRK